MWEYHTELGENKPRTSGRQSREKQGRERVGLVRGGMEHLEGILEPSTADREHWDILGIAG